MKKYWAGAGDRTRASWLLMKQKYSAAHENRARRNFATNVQNKNIKFSLVILISAGQRRKFFNRWFLANLVQFC